MRYGLSDGESVGDLVRYGCKAVLHFATDSRHCSGMPRSALALVALFMVVSAPDLALTANRAKVSSIELAQAINFWDAVATPQKKERISPPDIRIIQCVGPDEEPTEFQCTWRQRVGHGWVRRTTWLAIDGEGWHVID